MIRNNYQIKSFLFLITLLFFITPNFLAQKTNYYGRSKIQSEGFSGALYDVEIDRINGYTYVRIEQIPTKNMTRMKAAIPSYNAIIKSDDYESKYLGILEKDRTIKRTSCIEGMGWNNVIAGESYIFTCVFEGSIPPGLKYFSLIDKENNGCHGYGFNNYILNNPDTHPKTIYSEIKVKQIIDENNDGINGIYEPFDKADYKLGCIKEGDNYKLIYLGSEIYRSWWKVGDVKAILRPSAEPGVYKAEWYMADKSINNDSYVFFNGNTFKSILNTNEGSEESSYLKMYPSASSSINSDFEKSSGTGFALTSNGYIVTNYHVTNGAKKINVRGVNGDFNKKVSAKIIVEDKINDLSIIKIEDPTFISFGQLPYVLSNKSLDVGSSIFVLGYPLLATMGDEVKLTNGLISSKSGFQGDATTYQISAPVQPGNSGGPLFDKNGNIVGIVNAKHTGAENVSYAIKVSYLMNLIDLIPTAPKLQTISSVTGKPLTEQVKILKKFTYIIEIN